MRLIAIGDSIVAGVGDPDHQGWVGRAIAGWRGISLYNLGVRRETSADILSRWEGEARPRMVDHEPMRLVFSFGLNDCNAADDGSAGVRVPPVESLKNAQAILSAAQKLAPTLLVGPPPTAEPGVTVRAEALNDLLQALAGRLKIPFIDVFRPLAAGGLWQAEAAQWDGAHPGAAGYQQMADLVRVHPAWTSFLTAQE